MREHPRAPASAWSGAAAQSAAVACRAAPVTPHRRRGWPSSHLVEQRLFGRRPRGVENEIGAVLAARSGGPVNQAEVLVPDLDVQRFALRRRRIAGSHNRSLTENAGIADRNNIVITICCKSAGVDKRSLGGDPGAERALMRAEIGATVTAVWRH
ncbi:exported hypothetical protein [Paraburkholderia piptadeniae]|uniref:Uncharacterized protein n=1 Tax=Paraburkholderia piptadeniae TaxID=1701573 RepID=A0A1N7SWD2_9BURK|nr:exported hypothetical protein [Paraburkholderia piptadeniae]